jgi:hypothetical protein
MRRVNGWLTMFWIAMIPISYATGWLKSVVFVSALSLWALVSGHWAAWQAARVEVAQQKEIDRQHTEPVEEKVVDRIVQKTGLAPLVTRASPPLAAHRRRVGQPISHSRASLLLAGD